MTSSSSSSSSQVPCSQQPGSAGRGGLWTSSGCHVLGLHQDLERAVHYLISVSPPRCIHFTGTYVSGTYHYSPCAAPSGRGVAPLAMHLIVVASRAGTP